MVSRRRFLMGMCMEHFEDYLFSNLYYSIIPSTINSKVVKDSPKTKLVKYEGNSVVENQLAKEINSTNWFSQNANAIFSSGKVIFTATAQYGNVRTNDAINIIAGHKYLAIYTIKLTTASSYNSIRVQLRDGTGTISFTYLAETTNRQTAFGVLEARTSEAGGYIRVIDNRESGWDSVQVENVMLIDLTQKYPFDTPTSLTDTRIQAYLNEGYHSYNSGSIEDSVLGELKSFDTNNQELDTLQLPAPLQLSGVGTIHDTFEVLSDSYRFTRNVGNYTFSGNESWTFQRTGNAGDTYKRALVSADNKSLPNFTGKLICSNGYQTTVSGIYGGNFIGIGFDQRECYVCVPIGNNPNTIFTSGTKVLYQLATPQVISIPKKHLGCIKDISTQNWQYNGGSTNWFYLVVSDIKTTGSNLYCSAYKTLTYGTAMEDNSLKMTTGNVIVIRDNSCNGDINTFKQKNAGVPLFYETNTEVADFTNNLKCEKGGTISGYETRLPREYQEVEYIESSGTQYIDSGVEGKYGISTYAKVDILSPINANACLLGCRSGGGDFRFYVGYRQYTNTINIGYKIEITSNVAPTPNTVKEYEYSVDNGYLTIKENGNTILSQVESDTTFYTNLNMWVFANNYQGVLNNSISAKLYSLKIWYNGALVRNFIPCFRKSDNVIGLYDLVNNQFYTNAGTGTFTKGSNVIAYGRDCQVLPNVEMKIGVK